MKKKISEFLIEMIVATFFFSFFLGIFLYFFLVIVFGFDGLIAILITLTLCGLLSYYLLSLPPLPLHLNCPNCKEIMYMLHDKKNRRYFECDNCGYFEYHLPGLIKGKKVKNKKPNIICPYCKWKNNVEQQLYGSYHAPRISRLRNMGGLICPKCGYDTRGPRCNYGTYSSNTNRSTRCFHYWFYFWHTGRRWDKCKDCEFRGDW